MIEKKIPRIIWIYWDKGFDNAPFVVRKCADSWQKHNPGWDVRLLDDGNIKRYFDISAIVGENRPDISIQKISNIIRINLLSRFGGVWVDAACYCRKPLDEWLDAYWGTGFFAFKKTEKDRILSNWFLAATQGNHLLTHFTAAHNAFWADHVFTNQHAWYGNKVRKKLRKWLNTPCRARLWLHPLFTDFLKIYPYYIFHYHFEKVISSDEQSRSIWASSPALSSDGPRAVRILGFSSPVTQDLLDRLKEIDAPVYKLDWRLDVPTESGGTLAEFILSGGESRQ